MADDSGAVAVSSFRDGAATCWMQSAWLPDGRGAPACQGLIWPLEAHRQNERPRPNFLGIKEQARYPFGYNARACRTPSRSPDAGKLQAGDPIPSA